MRFRLVKEALVASFLYLFITFIISYFPIKFEFIKPIKQDFEGFDIYDLVYSGKGNFESGYKDTNIVIIQVADSREEISKQIKNIESLQPSVVGVDVNFSGTPGNFIDSELANLLSSNPNIIPCYGLEESESEKFSISDQFLAKEIYLDKGGYVNFSEDSKFSVIRSFAPFVKKDSLYYSFAARILQKFSPDKYNTLKKRGNEFEYINYAKNLKHYITYTSSQFNQFLADKKQLEHIKGKIVLLGGFSSTEVNPTLEDLYFSPMNEYPNGKSTPDIYGVVIHANILSMLVGSEPYIKTKSLLFSYLLAFIFVFLSLLFVFSRYFKSEHPSHLVFLAFGIIEVIFLVYFFLKIFDWFHIRVHLGPIILSIILAIEAFEIYKILAKWMNEKFNYQTIFKSH
jgi:CHASE2 domain-containing sensor protein